MKYYSARGSRKTAHAHVKLLPGNGKVIINSKELNSLNQIKHPIDLVGESDKWDIEAYVSGGGFVSQIESVKLGISRGLVKINSEFKIILRKSGFLTRDQRQKERKKPGLKRARRAPQWSKR